MKRRKYIYTNKTHPQKAIMATILGIISFVSMAVVVYLAYLREGQTQAGYGLTGLLATIYSLVGFVLGASSLQNKDCYRIFPVLGITINLAVLLEVGFLVYWGTAGI
ncbi:MAG: DUF6142 family protein [Roseburia sp.]|nr:DUF6142 family protein [Roseburia sp.]